MLEALEYHFTPQCQHYFFRSITNQFNNTVYCAALRRKYYAIVKGGLSWSVRTNLTLCQLHYMYLCEDVVQIMYAPLQASVIGIREVHGCTTIHVQLTVRLVTRRYLQRFRPALKGVSLCYYACSARKTCVLQFVQAGLLS